eukprot:CAMPEP_0198317260 /NCGR_PEP_ID=MMETSP1450-20131203/6795_1 /TAXON_ID=753684 ORGANISM="Madagascaria erythrocladiodes, Strain CCMP3234" /NCGR_SAMPLE_ID=MMETSP1450 /ASSEMBLY_ACC=CAM_ASM_001115 /LENGTH=206 /DNA_ID=CAMNT_0044020449 /DNA_START=175 /DNA_END=795 /DNA_ORIENTATION=+
MNVVVIAGSVRRNAHAPRVAGVVVRELEARHQHKVTLVDMTKAEYEHLALVRSPYHHAKENASDELKRAQALFAAADVVVCVAGEYNWAPSPAMLACLDNFHKETWGGKTAGIVTFGGQSAGGARAGYVLLNTVAEVGMFPLPKQFALSAPWKALDDDGALVDDGKKAHLAAFVDQLLEFAAVRKAGAAAVAAGAGGGGGGGGGAK